MTVGADVEKAMATAKSLEACMIMFAQATENQQAKTMYEQLATQMCDITQALEQRLQEIQGEEPQY